MKKLTAERQSTESEMKQWHSGRFCKTCYVCKKDFVEGDDIYVLINVFNGQNIRHATCLRHPVQSKDKSSDFRPSASSTGRRRRTGGHGFSGGDGFQDI